MDARTEARYLDFVAQATPALFRVAYALTGRQQDAEDLLQTALERLVPRWRRVDDPMAYVRKVIYHEHIGRWRRWGRREAGYVGDDARELRERFREVAVVEIASGDGWQVPLELPADRDGVRLFWLDDDHLAVAVADPNAPVVRAPRGSVTFPDSSILTIGGGASPLIDEVLIYQAGGGLAGRVAVDQQDYLASRDPRLLWDVEQATRDGMLVLRRQPDGTTIELAAVDPGDGAVAATVRLELPPAPAGHYWLPAGPYELTAVVDRQVLVGVALTLEPTNPDFQQRQDPVAHDYYLADLAAGSARLANLPPLPDDAWWLSFTHADGLPPASAEHAFRP